MYNWLYFIITSWLRRWKSNTNIVSSGFFSNAILDVAIVTLLGFFFNPNFFSAFFPILFSVDILTCMNFINWFCLHFENISNVAFWTETSLISFSRFWKNNLYTYLFPEVILSWPPHLIGWHHLLPFLFCSFFHFILYLFCLDNPNVAETNGLIILLVASTISIFSIITIIYNTTFLLFCKSKSIINFLRYVTCFQHDFELLRKMFLNHLHFRSGDTSSLCF